MRILSSITVLLLVGASFPDSSRGQVGEAPEIDGPKAILSQTPFALSFTTPEGDDSIAYRVSAADGRVLASGIAAPGALVEVDGLRVVGRADLPLQVSVGDQTAQFSALALPGWFSVLPPLLAIALALIFREVVISLFAGIWLGALFVAGLNPVAALLRTIDAYILPALANPNNASIAIFSLMLGGMVGLMGRSGGTRGIVEAVAPLATNRRRGQLATFAAGLAIFFDDYANTLIVGNTMRPITDRLRISREKLAYVVDSTAAPVAAIVFVSTWAGYEMSLIENGLEQAAAQVVGSDPGLAASLRAASAFEVFLHTIPYLFYPILALALVFLVSFTLRDFGPMLAAEQRSVSGGGLHRPGAMLLVDTSTSMMEPEERTPRRWYNAALPVLTVVLVVLLGLYFDGRAALGRSGTLTEILGKADPFKALLCGSLSGVLVAAILPVAQRILTLTQAMEAWLAGLRAMMLAIVILVLAWSLGNVTQAVGTAPYVSYILETSGFPLQMLPFAVFISAAAIAFATGTSWATMAILLPLVIPLAVTLGGGIGFASGANYTILLGTISSVLAGSIFGDHCSPISDTTVLSSMASASDHVDHVRTQLPYALLVAVIGLIVGDLATAFGMPWMLSYVIGIAALYAVLRFLGRSVEPAGAPVREQPIHTPQS